MTIQEYIQNKDIWWNPELEYKIDTFWQKMISKNLLVLNKERYMSLFYQFEFTLRELNNPLNDSIHYLIELSIVKSSLPLSVADHELIQKAVPLHVDLHYGAKKYESFTNFLEDDFHEKAYPSLLLLPFESLDMAISYYEFWKEKVLIDHVEDLENEEILATNILLWKNN